MNTNPRYSLSFLRLLLVFTLPFVISACAPLQQVSLPDEYTPEPSTERIWTTLANIQPNDWFVLLNEGPEALEWRLLAIDSAVESIDLQTFLWEFDTVGTLVLDRLVNAADRGVLVKILVDDSFLISEDDILEAIVQHPNIEYRVFNPYKRRTGSMLIRQLLNLSEFRRVDHRMHNKAMVVDNRVAIVGGRNLADEYFGLHSEANFRDMELLVGGPIVEKISSSFDDYFNDDWSIPIEMITEQAPDYAELESIREGRNTELYRYAEGTYEQRARRWQDIVGRAIAGTPELFVDRPPVDNPAAESSAPVQLAEQLVRLFDSTEREILILSAYLIPSADFEGAIENAVKRGVKVRILTNSIRSNNHLAAHSAYRKHIRELLEGGASLHEVRFNARDRYLYMFPPIDKKALALHAKVMILDDDKVFIGSTNLDPRSFFINTEMGLVVKSAELNAQLRAVVERDFAQKNAWQLQIDEEGNVVWVSEDIVLTSQPAGSFMQRLEDWFLMHLPIEDEI